MFTKKQILGSAHAYRTVTDWEAVGRAIGIGLIVLFFIGVALHR
jgi:hypothetical protein